jgi:hypothetical protein
VSITPLECVYIMFSSSSVSSKSKSLLTIAP